MTPETLHAAFLALPPLPKTNGFWNERRAELRERLNSEGWKPSLSSFLRWSEIETTMFVGNGEVVQREFEALKTWHNYPRALHEAFVGSPVPLANEPWTSGNMVHQAYHLMQWEAIAGRKVSELHRIVEVGGGYGAMACVLRRAGFAGEYIIYDLPELSLLQRYYLEECGVGGVRYIDHAPEREIECDLLIGLWSLSEMQSREQHAYLSRLCASHYLLAVNDAMWQGFNSRAALLALPCERVPAMPAGSYYLIA